MNRIKLYDALKASYSNRDEQKNIFKNKGYVFDSDISDKNEAVWYNPKDKKLLFTVKGTNPLSLEDIGTDAYLAGGFLKNTNRYKTAEIKLREAKKRYNPLDTSIIGDSLGGSISQYIGNKNDKIYTNNKGSTFGTPTRNNEKGFRTSGDGVSLLSAFNKNTTTYKNPNFKTGILPIDILRSHNFENIKNTKSNIFI